MKKSFLAISLIGSLLYAGDFEEALKIFENGDYSASYNKFKEILKSDYANSEVNFYLGRSAFEVGDYDTAISAYERILIASPDHHRSRLELGRTYIALGDTQRATIELRKVLDSNPPESVRKNIEAVLESIESKEKRYSFTNSLYVGVAYDTNVNSSPAVEEIEQYFTDIGLDGDVKSEGSIEDGFGYETLSSNFVYDFGKSGGFYSDTYVTLYNQHYFDRSEYDIQYGAFSTSLSYVAGNARISLPISYERIDYEYDHLLDIFAFTPRISYAIDKNSLFYMNFKIASKVYDEKSNKDAIGREFGMGYFRDIDGHIVGVEGLLSRDSAKRDSEENYIDKHSSALTLSYKKELFSFVDLALSYRYKVVSYSDIVASGDEREDKQSLYGISFSKKFMNDLGVIAGYSYNDNNSNYAISDYDKSTVSVALTYSF